MTETTLRRSSAVVHVRFPIRWLVSAICGLVVAQALAAPSPTEILNRALNLQKGVRDYIATVTVTTDIPGLELPVRTAKVYVKTPDKTYVESEGIVAIPKRALLFGALDQDISKHATVTMVGQKSQGGAVIYCLKITPKSPQAGRSGQPTRVLVWINGSRWSLDRLQVLAGDKVQLTVDFAYEKIQGLWMPIRVTSTVPKGMLGSDKPGHVTITFSNYQVNTGLTDEFFAEKQKQQQWRPRRRGSHGRGAP